MITNFQLEKIAEEIERVRVREIESPINYIVMKDELKNIKRKNGGYIINLDNSKSEGAHWTALFIHKNIAVYFDSFGCPCPESIIKFCKSKNSHLYFNTRVIQDLDSNLCGFYCIAFLKFVSMSNKSLLKSSNDFSNMFDNSESELNGYLLKGYLNKFNIPLKKYLFNHK